MFVPMSGLTVCCIDSVEKCRNRLLRKDPLPHNIASAGLTHTVEQFWSKFVSHEAVSLFVLKNLLAPECGVMFGDQEKERQTDLYGAPSSYNIHLFLRPPPRSSWSPLVPFPRLILSYRKSFFPLPAGHVGTWLQPEKFRKLYSFSAQILTFWPVFLIESNQ
jgi:hypothetical protein